MVDLWRPLITACVLACVTLSGCGSEGGKPSAERPADTSADTETDLTSEIPLSSSEEKDIRDQVERNWNLGNLAGSPDLADMMVELRIGLAPDGTVTKVEVLNNQPNHPEFRQAAESAMRAVMISSPLKLPPGKAFPMLLLRFYPGEVVQ